MDDRHERHHVALEAQQAKVDRIWQAAYDRAKARRVRAYRQSADTVARSHRTSLYYSWRSHLQSMHGKKLGPFTSMDDLHAMHEVDHKRGR
jgi:hypothetical protein